MRRVIGLAMVACLLAAPAAWGAEILYGADGGGGDLANLYILNPATGAIVSTVGPIGFAVTGLAIHPLTGVLYGSTGQHSPNAPDSLIRIKRTTGQGTLIGSYGIGAQTMADLTSRSDGMLYGWLEPGADCLHTINLTNGQATPVGALETRQAAQAPMTIVGYPLPASSADKSEWDGLRRFRTSRLEHVLNEDWATWSLPSNVSDGDSVVASITRT